MPSVTIPEARRTEQLRSSPGSPRTHIAQQSRKPYDREQPSSIGNAFVWTQTNDANGDRGHGDPSSDGFPRSGSLHPTAKMNGVTAASAGSSGRGRSQSRNGSLFPLEALSEQGNSNRHLPNGWTVSSPEDDDDDQHHDDCHHQPLVNGVSDHQTGTSVVNGTDTSSRRRSPSPRTTVNGDHSSTSDDQTSADITPQTSVAPSLPNGQTPSKPNAFSSSSSSSPFNNNNHHNNSGSSSSNNNNNNDNHQSERYYPSMPRQHSPSPAPSSALERPISPTSSAHAPLRSTLQVPKFTPGRKNSQASHHHHPPQPNYPSVNAANPSEDTLSTNDRFSSDRFSTDRFSSSASAGLRRASLSLARRAPRPGQSDTHLDEAPQDEEAARWTETIKHKRASKRRKKEEEDDDRVMVGTKVDQNHVNWVTAYNMLTGIRFTVSRTNAKMDRELTDADFEAKHKFSFDITGNELTPSAKYDFKFKDYAPWVFRHLRAKFQLDPADYLVSLTSKYILSELGSPGKSGSFFYFSRDYKYIIKTIHHAEHKLLRRILRDYYHHIENNPNTLISQFYGLHRVKMAYGRKIHFVVMNNLFPPHRDIHQMFDLKGSTIGRDFREDDLEKNPRATLKDLNWLRRNRHLELGPMKREVFLAQLKRDVALLQKLKIMDYSLLIGIHNVEKGNEEKLRDRTLQVFQPGAELSEDQQSHLLMRTPSRLENARKARELREIIKREKPVPMEQTTAKMPDEILDERKNHVFYSDEGGFRATHENGEPAQEIYYLGVIDCLTHYGFIKKAEHFWKGLSHNRNQISPIPPQAYGERFLNFITGITKSKEEAEREAQEQADRKSKSQDARRSSVEKFMEKAQKQVAKSSKTLAEDPEPRERVLSTIRTAGPDLTGRDGASTLPIVQEAGEGSSGKGEPEPALSGVANADRNPAAARPHTPHSVRTSTAPSGRSPTSPPTRLKPDAANSVSMTPRGKGKERMRGNANERDKGLPMLPNGPPPPPPTTTTVHPHSSYVSSR